MPRILFITTLIIFSIFSASCTKGQDDHPLIQSHASPHIVGNNVASLASMHEGPSAFDTNSDQFYFTRADNTFSTSYIYRMNMDGSEEPFLAPFSKGSYSAGTTFHPDNQQVIFTSKMPTHDPALPDEWNLWIADVNDKEIMPLPEPVNSSSSDCCAVFTADGSFLFSSDRSGSWDIYRAREDQEGRFSVSLLKGSINSEHGEWPSYVSPDGSMILFSSIRPNGPGGDDIFAACKQADDSWLAQRLPIPINSEAYEDSGMITPDGKTFLWSSWRQRPSGEKLADIYSMDLAAAGLPEC